METGSLWERCRVEQKLMVMNCQGSFWQGTCKGTFLTLRIARWCRQQRRVVKDSSLEVFKTRIDKATWVTWSYFIAESAWSKRLDERPPEVFLQLEWFCDSVIPWTVWKKMHIFKRYKTNQMCCLAVANHHNTKHSKLYMSVYIND